MELAWRLPGVWSGVLEGRVAVWRALAIADKTRLLPAKAAAYVDQHLAGFAATCTWAQIDRVVQEAVIRFDPEAAEAKAAEAMERRRFDVHTDQVTSDGLVHVDGALDLADALDLDAAVGDIATQLGQLGCTESYDVRRSMALGELARADQQTLPLPVVEVRAPASLETTTPRRPLRPRRKVVLYLHLAADPTGHLSPVGRVENTRTAHPVGLIKTWLDNASVTVKPVIDLADHQPVDAYEIPDRHREHVILRDPHCVFPHCTRPARSCDIDHVVPHGVGGPTSPPNLATLCRRHHRAKTHGTWRYRVIRPGSYQWTSPHGHRHLVDARGTHSPPPDE